MSTLSSIDKQIADLMAQKTKLIDDEKKAALKKVNDAIKELNALGFNYSLSEGGASTRRTGIRKDVLAVIQGNPSTRADVIAALGAQSDKKAQQAISNALAALKKANQVSLADGTYSPS